jgi:hypothetical protein
MTPKTIIILSAVAILNGSILISKLFDFIYWLKKKKERKKNEYHRKSKKRKRIKLAN